MEMDSKKAAELVSMGNNLSSEEIASLQEERLKTLVEFARTHSKFYSKLYQGLKEPYSLRDIPVTDKKSLTQDMDLWFTDPEVTAASVEKFLDENTNPAAKLLDKYSVLTTSGTSGHPMPMVRDESHDRIHGALTAMRLLGSVDTELLNPLKNKIAAVIFASGKVSSYTSFKKMLKAYGATEAQAIAVSIQDPVSIMTAKLNAFQPQTLTGYPSALAALANEQLQGRLHISPLVIACSAETLTREMYNVMRKAFSCPVLNNYCSTEGGEIAMSCPEGYMHINSDWIIVEPIDENGAPVPDGQLSKGVLITDLTNFIQPVIRYRVDDAVRVSHEPCPCGRKFPTIEIVGRMGGSFTLDGKQVLTIPLLTIMEEEEAICGIINYQFIQTGPYTLEFRAEVIDPSRKAFALQHVCDRVYKYISDCGIPAAILHPSDQPLIPNPKGGKMQHFVA